MNNQINSLISISPIDGRYRYITEEFSNYFSEFAVIKYRLEVEIKYLIMLSEIGVIRKLKTDEIKKLNNIFTDINLNQAEEIKQIEKITRHDKKAIEYYIKNILSNSSLKDILEFVHFALTSYDVENIVHRLMLKEGLNQSLLPKLIELNSNILKAARKNKSLTMLARTHGQPAVPTTLGKEFLVFYERLKIEIEILENIKLRGKLNGAVGNYNAHLFTYPNIDWQKFSNNFLKKFQFETFSPTTQIPPYEDIIFLFQTIQRINGILLDFNQDMWRYISDGWLTQENNKEKVGSSTMPQKINPINFEQSEGNIIIANSLIEGFTNKLPVSRLQRDLSDSTIARNFGVVFAHSFLAFELANKGLDKIKPDKIKILEALNEDWTILAEAVQVYLKKNGIRNGYEILKDLTRGEKMNQEEFVEMINKLPLNNKQKEKLKKLTPENYIEKY